MTLEEIIKLIDAGYTKADIEKMQAPAAEEKQPEPVPAPEPKPKPVPAPEPKPKPVPAPEPKPEEKKPETKPVNNQMLKELQDLKKAVYAMNIMNTEQPEQRETVDDILAKALKEG